MGARATGPHLERTGHLAPWQSNHPRAASQQMRGPQQGTHWPTSSNGPPTAQRVFRLPTISLAPLLNQRAVARDAGLRSLDVLPAPPIMPLFKKPESPSSARKPAIKLSPPPKSRQARGTSADGRQRAATPQQPAAAVAAAPQPQPTVTDDFAVPIKEVVRPDNQLQLSEKELGEEIARTLTANNPQAPANLARYNFKDRCYRAEPLIDQLLQHLQIEGCLAQRGSEEAARDQQHCEAASRRATEVASRRVTEAAGTAHPSEAGEPQAQASSAGGTDPKLRNQFNSVDRGAQTGHNVPKDRSTMTEPPPTAEAAGSCTRWEIYDAYVEDHERQRQQEEAAKQRAAVARKGQQAAQLSQGRSKSGQQEQAAGQLQLGALPRSAAVMERIVNQNLFSDVIMDFKYWDDPADGVREQEGTLLPLWEFVSPAAKHRQVTAICWNPQYSDLFAVGYGSFDFQRPTTGVVCCYTLKNPSSAEVTFNTAAGVMCIAFHPDYPNLLAVGCYDGSVLIFDMRSRSGKPLYQSTAKSGKHTEPVWQVSWQHTDSHELQFYSISTDGRVTLWSVSKNELSFQDLLQLRLLSDGDQENQDDNDKAAEVAGGMCFDFNPDQDYLFVVGTEEGQLFKCSTAYSSEYLQTFSGHKMPVYGVCWNAMHPRIFLSGSADWTVKLWDSLQEKPVMTFDLSSPVGDLAWAPFSSTVFAAVTDSGKAFVFDLAQNRHRACCVQKVSKKSKLTKLAFNAEHPILLVGDDRGRVVCLKLSPNLRKQHSAAAAARATQVTRTESQRQSERQAEAARLDAVMDIARRNNAQLGGASELI